MHIWIKHVPLIPLHGNEARCPNDKEMTKSFQFSEIRPNQTNPELMEKETTISSIIFHITVKLSKDFSHH